MLVVDSALLLAPNAPAELLLLIADGAVMVVLRSRGLAVYPSLLLLVVSMFMSRGLYKYAEQWNARISCAFETSLIFEVSGALVAFASSFVNRGCCCITTRTQLSTCAKLSALTDGNRENSASSVRAMRFQPKLIAGGGAGLFP